MASYPANPTSPGRKGTVVQFDIEWNGHHLPNPTSPGRKGTVVQFDEWNGYHLPNPTTPGRKGTVVQFDIESPSTNGWSIGTLRFGGGAGWR